MYAISSYFLKEIQQSLLEMDKSRMNGVSQRDKPIKTEEMKSVKRRGQKYNCVDFLIFQNRTLIDSPTVVIQKDQGLGVIDTKIPDRRVKTDNEP